MSEVDCEVLLDKEVKFPRWLDAMWKDRYIRLHEGEFRLRLRPDDAAALMTAPMWMFPRGIDDTPGRLEIRLHPDLGTNLMTADLWTFPMDDICTPAFSVMVINGPFQPLGRVEFAGQVLFEVATPAFFRGTAVEVYLKLLHDRRILYEPVAPEVLVAVLLDPDLPGLRAAVPGDGEHLGPDLVRQIRDRLSPEPRKAQVAPEDAENRRGRPGEAGGRGAGREAAGEREEDR